VDLKQQIIDLAPWHLDVQVGGLSTTIAPQEDGLPIIDGRSMFVDVMERVYPDGLEGRSFLDCACNCGGFSLWAKEMGAGRTFGFDVREHWIRQARFLAEARGDDASFEVVDLFDLPKLNLEPFDITLFKGILYHLEDPMRGLRIAADATKELLIVNTATRNDYPDGALVALDENVAHLMSGIVELAWLPTGPGVLKRMLGAVGFPETRVNFYWEKAPPQRAELGRLELLAARTPETFRAFDVA
jgi:tRNA (mo5U34)-methyltransferase